MNIRVEQHILYITRFEGHIKLFWDKRHINITNHIKLYTGIFSMLYIQPETFSTLKALT